MFIRIRAPFVIFLLLAFAMTSVWLRAADFGIGQLGKRSGAEQQRVEKPRWSSGESNTLMQKRFELKEWDKHYSSLGGKRSPISTADPRERKKFEGLKRVEQKQFSTKNAQGAKMSRWNERMADLHKQARISTDDSAKKIADAELYGAMLQNTQKYAEMGEKVSLRDINRFQFRRNRSDDGIPVEKAGEGR